MQMLCIAAEANPIGYVTVGARPMGATDLARLTGGSEAEVRTLLDELDRNGVFSRDRKGCIYNRRMVRDARITERNKKNGRKGGNPVLTQPVDIPQEPGTGITGGLRLIPESRVQKERLPNGSSQPPPPRRTVAEHMVEIWKIELGDVLTVPAKLTEDRITRANARYRNDFNSDTEEWRAYCQQIRSLPFLLGDSDRAWRADFDWAIRPKSVLAVREGKYSRRNPQRQFAGI